MRQNPGFDDLTEASVLDALALSLPSELRPVHRRIQETYASAGESDGHDLAADLEVWHFYAIEKVPLLMEFTLDVSLRHYFKKGSTSCVTNH